MDAASRYQLLKMAAVVDSTQRRTEDVKYRKKYERDVYSKQWDNHVSVGAAAARQQPERSRCWLRRMRCCL
jgi:hypothetical protein